MRRLIAGSTVGDDTAERLLPFPETLRVFMDTWDKPRLEEQLRRIQALKASMGGIFPYDLPRKDRRRMEKLMARDKKGGR